MQKVHFLRNIAIYGALIIQTTLASAEYRQLDEAPTSEGRHFSLTHLWAEQKLSPRNASFPVMKQHRAGSHSSVSSSNEINAQSESVYRYTLRQRWLLSLDGGGARGLMQLHTLAELERRTGKSIPEMFDGISGTSIGGMIACLLTMPDPENPTRPKYSARALLTIFQENLGRLFVSKWQSFGGLLRTRYKTSSIKEVLDDLLKDNTFKNRLLPVVLVTHDLNLNEERLISTTDEEDFLTRHVAMATGAAPTYFKPQHVFPINIPNSRGYVLSDGGTCMNNPTLPGLALMHAHYGVRGEDVKILSLGTGMPSTTHMNEGLLRGGILKWGGSIADTCIAGQSSAAHHLTHAHFGSHYYRFNPILAPENMRLDDISEGNQDALFAANRRMLSEERKKFNAVIKALKSKSLVLI